MKLRTAIPAATLATLALALAAPAHAATLYDNGAFSGISTAYGISGGYQVTDSFTLASPSSLTSAQAGLWTFTGYTPVALDWSIGTTPYASDLYSGTGAPLSSTFLGTVLAYSDYESTFPISGSLPAGNYWLTLQNGTTTSSGEEAVSFWDRNLGPATAFDNYYGSVGSESFQLYGDVVPEPASLSLLSLAAVALLTRRRKHA